MIRAKVTHIVQRTDGGMLCALARSQQLDSNMNRSGKLRFNLEPLGWMHGRTPQVGQVVVLGKLINATVLVVGPKELPL